ncbi:MAG: nicotinate-nucleotide--dimethylbenzimidazole phosphoribosyltransferase [Myxococcota bacterium]|nr:nicotinate-nucleotide--dimethylbenzimidazole phosphoribosyltransferase [Myxococcota bacterium]
MSKTYSEIAQHQLNALAKPPGALGQLEAIALRLSEAQQKFPPTAHSPHVLIFAGDHGVTEENISAYPSEVTLAMIATISSGKSAVGVLAQQSAAQLRVVNVGAKNAPPSLHTPDWIKYINASVGQGTQNICIRDAMTIEETQRAIEVGRQMVRDSMNEGADVVVIGEMGIGNTTPAAAITSKILGIDPSKSVGPGTGLNPEGVNRKIKAVQTAIERSNATGALKILAALGGFEIAAMTGAMQESAKWNIPVILDGYIASAAALIAFHQNEAVSRVLIPATCSAEPGHIEILKHLKLNDKPLLNWGLRLGEGSAATLFLPIVKSACAICSEMATLESVLTGAP